MVTRRTVLAVAAAALLDPRSCRIGQIDRANAYDLGDVLVSG